MTALEQVRQAKNDMIAWMLEDLGKIPALAPDQAVRHVGAMVANSGTNTINARGRLSDVRALAAYEFRLGAGAELSVAKFAEQLGGITVTRALYLVARGRQLMGEPKPTRPEWEESADADL